MTRSWRCHGRAGDEADRGSREADAVERVEVQVGAPRPAGEPTWADRGRRPGGQAPEAGPTDQGHVPRHGRLQRRSLDRRPAPSPGAGPTDPTGEEVVAEGGPRYSG